ncbi:hypothetical protein J41TS4_41170 [Paenibacillus apis]|uniref:Uncharacterized protein n=1 Tax=Paenibacillus apis TaxID=1792174 RepID=A0A919Y4N9_9BACL|nr:hypothetical protein J41TS4_41170 [Paenibacillus apis]
MQWPTFAARIAAGELSALERLPVHPPEIPLAHPVRQVRSGIPEILRRYPALEKIPYVIAPFNE